MRVAALSYLFPPIPSAQSIQVSRIVTHLGLEVHMYCADEKQSDPSLGAALDSSVEVRRIPWPRWAGGSSKVAGYPFRSLPDRYLPWAAEAVRRVPASHRFQRGDVLLSFGWPMSAHLAALRIANRTKLPWVAHFSDTWATNPFKEPKGPVYRLTERMERAVVGRADGVVVTTEETRDLMIALHGPGLRERCLVMPHSFDSSLYPVCPPRPGGIVVRHLGEFYGRRTPEPLFGALSILSEHDPGALAGVRVELIGKVDPSALTSRAYRSLPAGLVQVVPRVDYLASLAKMKEAHLLIVIEAPMESSPFLPSKAVEYLGACRPILGIVPPGPTARLIHGAGGWVAHPTRPAEVADRLHEALGLIRQQGADGWGNGGWRASFQVERVTRPLTALLERLSVEAVPLSS